MKRLYAITGILLKLLPFIIFYFWDLALSTSGNNPLTTILRSEEFQPVQLKITNELSEIDEFRHLEPVINRLLDKFDIKGASVAVAKDGRLVYAKGFGYADLEAEEPVEPRHQFRIASASKLITATAVFKMTESGLIDIDQEVFGPEGLLNDSIYQDYIDPRIENITVRNLLNHTVGWTRRFGDYMFIPHIISSSLKIELPVQVTDIIRFALKQSLYFESGTRKRYSNLNFAILGEIIGHVSGMSYEEYVRRNIFDSLGIYETRIGKTLEDDRFRNEVKYYDLPGAVKVASFRAADEVVPMIYGGNDMQTLGASGGWITSPVEYLKLVIAIDGRENSKNILSPESIEIMTTPELSGGHTMGWAGTDGNGNWWRTGTLSGTSVLAMRQNNGLNWVVFFNSSTVKGIGFPREVRGEMQRALNKISEWPDHDLFYYFETPPLLYPDLAEFN
jgi:CubicO group peptidase (beta-lactamase class C family)